MIQRISKFVLLLLGFGLFGWVVARIGLSSLYGIIPAVSGINLLVFLWYPVFFACLVWSWQVIFTGEDSKKVNFFDLYWIRIAGEALNNLTPGIDVGGEALKIFLVARHNGVSKGSALVTILVERIIFLFSEILFWYTGLFCIFAFFTVPVWLKGLVGVALGFLVIGIVLMRLQRKGNFLSLFKWLERILSDPGLARKLNISASFRDIDSQIARFYANKKRLAATVFWHYAFWALGAIEMFLMFRIVGVPITLLQAFVFEALIELVKTASFYIPANLGAQEAGLMMCASWQGFAPSTGVLVSLMKRLRQLIWTLVGLGVWGIYESFVYFRRNKDNRREEPKEICVPENVGAPN